MPLYQIKDQVVDRPLVGRVVDHYQQEGFLLFSTSVDCLEETKSIPLPFRVFCQEPKGSKQAIVVHHFLTWAEVGLRLASPAVHVSFLSVVSVSKEIATTHCIQDIREGSPAASVLSLLPIDLRVVQQADILVIAIFDLVFH